MIEVTPTANERDEQLSLDVYNAVWSDDRLTIEDVCAYKARASEYVDFLAHIDGAIAGSGFGSVSPQRPDLVFAVVTVLPEHRRQGAGSALGTAVSAWAARLGFDRMEVPVRDNDPESLAFADRRGFVEERRELGLVLHLADLEPPGLDPPDGVEIVTWAERPELAQGMYEVALEAEPDIPGYEDIELGPFEDWLASDMQSPSDRPEATFVALAGDEVVGYAKFALTAAQPTVAHHDISGVKRAWRGRGVARALKTAQIRWALANGYTELHTRNEQRNEPIRRLNERFGYRPGVGRIYVVGPVSGV